LKKILLAASAIIILFAGFIGLRFGSALTQEGNPLPYLISAAKIELTGNRYAKVHETTDKTRYLSEHDSKDRLGHAKEWMKKAGWTFEEQTGSGLVFAKEDEVITIETRQYSKHYVMWDVPK
jgi:hypothetical protein